MFLCRKLTLNLSSLPWKPSEQTKGHSLHRSIRKLHILLRVTAEKVLLAARTYKSSDTDWYCIDNLTLNLSPLPWKLSNLAKGFWRNLAIPNNKYSDNSLHKAVLNVHTNIIFIETCAEHWPWIGICDLGNSINWLNDLVALRVYK
jgi:hypothetical protein